MKVSFKEYLANPAVGSSSLRTMLSKSPAHYLHERKNPSEPTPAQKFGTMIHQAILEPKKFMADAVIEPEFAGKGSVAAREQWHLENDGKLILKHDQNETINGILNALSLHTEAFKYISKGVAEQSIFWKDHETGIACKARFDFNCDKHIIADVKTTEDASFAPFQKTISKYGYHIQAAMYLDGASEVFGQKYDEFVIIAVEKKAPYGVNCFLLDETMIMEGRALYKRALRTLRICNETNRFPGYPEVLNPVTLLSWAYQIGSENE